MKNYDFAYNLKFLRKCYKMTQSEIGRIVGKSGDAISRWELEQREPSDKDIRALCEYFGLDPADLVYRKLDSRAEPLLTEYERELLAWSRMLDSDKKQVLLSVAKNMVGADDASV